MAVVTRPASMTAADFIVWAQQQGDRRFELENGAPLELSAEKARHALAKHATARALEDAIGRTGLDCRVFPDGMTVVVNEQTVRLPDAAVQCTPFDLDSTILAEPIILVEIVSPSSAYRDENHKLAEYFTVPSVMHYLLVDPIGRRVVHFSRTGQPGRLDTRIVTEGTLTLAPPDIEIAVLDLFGDI